MDFSEFNNEFFNLKKSGKCEEAVNFFYEHEREFDSETLKENPYLISSVVICLRRINRVDEGFNLLKKLGVRINSDTNENFLTTYGWLLHSKFKTSGSARDKEKIISQMVKVIFLLKPYDTKYSRLLKTNLFLIVVKDEKSKNNPNWKFINDFCDKFDPNDLDENPYIKRESKGGKSEERASAKEEWYSYKSKALSKLERWQECKKVSHEALKLPSFHNDNKIWFKYRIALSNKNLGNLNEAVALFEKLLKTSVIKRNSWFAKKELSDAYLKMNDLDNAFKYAVQALNTPAKLNFKIDLIYLFAKILVAKGEKELALKHLLLYKLVRKENKWKVPIELEREIEKLSDGNIEEDRKKLESELKGYWRKFDTSKKEEKQKTLEGKIAKLLHDNERGKDGFIETNGKSYYFAVFPNSKMINKIKIRAKVKFKASKNNAGKLRAKIISVE
ncbi:DUF7017 domain-containing protein [Mesoaciditoga lauensis]|uniref:DUF7017 domain-containing protein n=1 Tax=Mesoaciditoga lauensis TaxID=1495039 RepID=UPI0005613677|nr:hypothetical protein [Mesoaciditoga lauensis]